MNHCGVSLNQVSRYKITAEKGTLIGSYVILMLQKWKLVPHNSKNCLLLQFVTIFRTAFSIAVRCRRHYKVAIIPTGSTFLSLLCSYAYPNLLMSFQAILKQQNNNLSANLEYYPETSYFPWGMSLFMWSLMCQRCIVSLCCNILLIARYLIEVRGFIRSFPLMNQVPFNTEVKQPKASLQISCVAVCTSSWLHVTQC